MEKSLYKNGINTLNNTKWTAGVGSILRVGSLGLS
jgi:hypothetical protein